VGYAGKNHHLMHAMGLEPYIQTIDDVDADRLVEQVQTARRDQAALTDRIRRVTADYPDRVRVLLDQVAVRALRLDPRPDEARPLSEAGAWPRT